MQVFTCMSIAAGALFRGECRTIRHQGELSMCPLCIGTATLLVFTGTSAGGFAAFLLRQCSKRADRHGVPPARAQIRTIRRMQRNGEGRLDEERVRQDISGPESIWRV